MALDQDQHSDLVVPLHGEAMAEHRNKPLINCSCAFRSLIIVCITPVLLTVAMAFLLLCPLLYVVEWCCFPRLKAKATTPGPFAFPIIGCIVRFLWDSSFFGVPVANPQKAFLKIAEDFRDFACVNLGIFNPRILLITEPDVVKHVLDNKDKKFV